MKGGMLFMDSIFLDNLLMLTLYLIGLCLFFVIAGAIASVMEHLNQYIGDNHGKNGNVSHRDGRRL